MRGIAAMIWRLTRITGTARQMLDATQARMTRISFAVMSVFQELDT